MLCLATVGLAADCLPGTLVQQAVGRVAADVVKRAAAVVEQAAAVGRQPPAVAKGAEAAEKNRRAAVKPLLLVGRVHKPGECLQKHEGDRRCCQTHVGPVHRLLPGAVVAACCGQAVG